MAGSAVDKLASIFGGLTGGAVEAKKTRKSKIDREEEKSMVVEEPGAPEMPAAPAPRRRRDNYPYD